MTEPKSTSRMLRRKIIEEIVSALRESPLADRIVVFGSLARGAPEPKDVDVVIDLRGRNGKDAQALSDILRLARRRYGWLDPFVETDRGLFVRNADATGWERAKRASEIREAIRRDGIALASLVLPALSGRDGQAPAETVHRNGGGPCP